MTGNRKETAVHVSCEACEGEFEVPAATLADSRALRSRGYPDTRRERPPTFFAALVDDTVLPGLVHAWDRVGCRVRERAAVGSPRLLLQSTTRLFELSRWADDGGPCLT